MRRPSGSAEALGTVLLLAGMLALAAHWLAAFEARPGAALRDPLLGLVAPRDLTWALFALTYGPLALTLARLAAEPPALLGAVQAYALLLALRVAGVGLVPLEPPPGLIPLADPIVALGTGVTLQKDLFFSGHVAMLVLCGLVLRDRAWRVAAFAAAALVGAGLIVQHVHYTIDVLAAPGFAWAAHRAVRALRTLGGWISRPASDA